MLADLSNTLRALLRAEGDATDPKLLDAVAFSFDRPSDGFAPTAPTIGLFLHDLREEAGLRSSEPELAYQGDGTVRRLRPPLRVDCSYMLTAWAAAGSTTAALDEQKLLGEAVRVLARHELIPEGYRQGLVKTMDPPPRIRLDSAGKGRARGLAELWSAVGTRLRPAILLKVTASVDANPVPAPVAEFLTTAVGLSVREADPSAPTDPPGPIQVGPSFVAGGRVTFGGVAAPGVVVRLAEPARQAVADEEGIFRLGALPPGTYAAVAEGQGPDGVARSKPFNVPVPVGPDGLVTIDLAT